MCRIQAFCGENPAFGVKFGDFGGEMSCFFGFPAGMEGVCDVKKRRFQVLPIWKQPKPPPFTSVQNSIPVGNL